MYFDYANKYGLFLKNDSKGPRSYLALESGSILLRSQYSSYVFCVFLGLQKKTLKARF